MQKIQSYLYPNRIILLANLAGFTVENTIVYQRTVKIYNGIDNVIEFDIQNADQKRIDLSAFTNLQLNLMDQAGNALPGSPYTITPKNQANYKGLATVTIPNTLLGGLPDQTFKFSVTAMNGTTPVILYTDSKFSAVGQMELNGSAMPLVKNPRVYKDFYKEINFMGNTITHTSVIATKDYETILPTELNFSIELDNLSGTVYIEATRDMTVSVNSFTNAPRVYEQTFTKRTGTIVIPPVQIGDYNYFRVSWVYPSIWAQTGYDTNPFGKVTRVTVNP